MAETHVYLAVQRLTLSNANWNTLVAAMQAKGDNASPRPNRRNHWRFSLDGTIGVFEAAFESANIDEAWFVDWAAGVFGVNPALVGTATGYNQYGRFSTFSQPAGVTNRMRIGVFGFVQGQSWPEYAQSHAAVIAYIGANRAAWEPVEQEGFAIMARLAAAGNALLGGRVDGLGVPDTVVAGRNLPAYTTRIGERIYDALPEGWRRKLEGA